MVEDTLVGADVHGGRRLVAPLDARGMRPDAVFWLRRQDSRSWRLLVSPGRGIDRDAFYRQVSKLYGEEGRRGFGVDLGSIGFVAADDPLLCELQGFLGPFDDDVAHVADIMLGGVFVEEAVVLRLP